VVIAIIGVPIALLVPAVQELRVAARAAAQFESMKDVASPILVGLYADNCVPSLEVVHDVRRNDPIVTALHNARAIVSAVLRDHMPPPSAMVAETLLDLQLSELTRREDIHAFKNTAPLRFSRWATARAEGRPWTSVPPGDDGPPATDAKWPPIPAPQRQRSCRTVCRAGC
jgi:hypothetical protein